MSINVNVGNFIPTSVLEVGNEISVNQLAAITAADSPSALNPFSTVNHIHVIGNITGLQTALDTKALLAHTHILGDITGLQLALDGKSSIAHEHTIGNIIGLPEALSLKAELVHTHTEYANAIHTHTEYANAVHTHAISGVTGLQTALDGKASTTHTHTQFALLSGATFSGEISAPQVGNILNSDLVIDSYNDTGAGTHYYHKFTPFDGRFVLAPNGGGLVYPDSTIQSTASYSKAQSDAHLVTVAGWVDTKADWGHTHTIANITGLQTALNDKASNASVALKVDKTAQVFASYDQWTYPNDSQNGVQFALYYSGWNGYGRVNFADNLAGGSRMFFTQSASATEPIVFTGLIYNKDNKLATTGPNAQVTAVKTSQGWQLFGDLIFIPNGVVMSTQCSEWTSTDAKGTSWTSFHAYTTVIADGQGSTYTTNTLNTGGCYFPYGYCIESNVQISSSTVYWDACDETGSATYSYSYGDVKADGFGSTFTETIGGWSANYGDYIHTTASGCTIYHNGMGGFYVVYPNPPPPCPDYGTEIGTNTGTLQVYYSPTGVYYDAGTFSETQYADGNCNVAYTGNRVDTWYPYGTWIGFDSMNNYNIYSDGSGSYYTEYYNPPSCPPSGEYVSGSSGDATVYYSQESMTLTAGTWYDNVYTDGNCSTYNDSGTSWYSYGTQIGYDSVSNLTIYSDGNGSYFTS